MEEGAIVKWYKKEGDRVEANELLIEVATDKATVEYNALDEGYLRKILVKEGKTVAVNEPIAIFTEKANESIEGYAPKSLVVEKKVSEEERSEKPVSKEGGQKKPTSQMQQPQFAPEPPLEGYQFEFPSSHQRTSASPLAKKIAKEKGLDLHSVKGSGPKGRITSRDLDLAQPDQTVSFGRKEIPSTIPGTYEEVPLTPMRKVIAERLQQAKTFIPHIYVKQVVDVQKLFEIREELKAGNVKVTFNDFVVRACALSLKEHPQINSGFHSANQSILLFKTIDIAVAVTVEGGLITPIIRHADYKNLGEISMEVKELASRAKLGKLEPEEYKGGSFTISNMGMFGVTDFAAIINPPQSSILAIGGIEECPVVKNGVVCIGKRMSIVLSADHRVVDGSDAAKFIKTVQKYLENPSLLLI